MTESSIFAEKPNGPNCWDELVEGYFNATLTEEEERLLRCFLASPGGQDARYDDVRSVMGFVVTARRRKERAARRSRGRHWRKVAAVAAVLLAIGLPSGLFLLSGRSDCVAYVGGKRITNPEKVMGLARESFSSVRNAPEDPTMDSQLRDMFSTIRSDDFR